MTKAMRTGLAAILGLVVGGTTIMTSVPVAAQGLFEGVFSPNRYPDRRRDFNSTRDYILWKQRRDRRIREEKPAKPVRISSPRYFVYKPDALKLFSFAELAKTRAAEADDAETRPLMVAEATVGGDSADDSAVASDAALVEPPAVIAFNAARFHLADVKLRLLPDVAKAVLAHYRETPRFVWVSGGRPNARAQAALAVFAEADAIGLDSAEYAVTLTPELERAIAAEEPIAADRPAAVNSPVLAHPPITADPMDAANPIAVDDPPITVDPREAIRSAAAANPPEPADPVVTGSIEAPNQGEERQRALIAFEIEMSARSLTYVLDATRGRVDPNRISGYHDLPRKNVDLAEALNTLAEADDVAAYLQSRSPAGAHFRQLVEELAALEGADDGQRVEIAPGTLIKPGRPNDELANAVAAIRLRGSPDLQEKHAETLGAYQGGPDYTPELVALVKDFQRENKLKPDGIVGRMTIRAMVGETNAAKIAKLKLAMERARWLPSELGERYVLVNQPAFTAGFHRSDRAPLTMRVVVGKKSNQTSFFTDKIETVEYNPYWGVPLSIIVNEMMPKLDQDPTYLDRIGYEVTTASGKRVSSASVDWYAVATKSQTINVRQLPGRGNALGELKILFPNKHHIYMHDTPSKKLFSRDRRAFSHGCIRLQNPRAMAAAVLGRSTDYIASRIAQGRNDSDPVAHDIPVYIAYFTAWPDAAGTVEYFADVYDRDVYLSRAVEATAKARRKGG